MIRLLFVLFFLFVSPKVAFAKCTPDNHRLLYKRWILEKSVPPGVEITDRVWLKNPTDTPLFTFTAERDAAKRTCYRELLGKVPTTDHELPAAKIVSGEHYEYHFPENPVYTDGSGQAVRAGWAHQDYPAALVEPKPPVIPPNFEGRLVSGKLSALEVRVPVPIYFGTKKSSIDFIFEFRNNPNFGKVDVGCPPVALPSPGP